MEVGPTCHYFMGGIRVEADTGASSVPGLYSAGECSGGMNGANRLGGNSLSDLLVFGRRAGEGAAAGAASASAPAIDEAQVAAAEAELTQLLAGPGGEDPYALHAELQRTMQDGVGIFRDGEGLAAAVAKLEELERRAADARSPAGGTAFNPGWHLCRDLRNMVVVAQAVTRAALLREESRGAQSRLDFPAFDDWWGEHNVVVSRGPGGEMRVEPQPVGRLTGLAGLVEERKAAEAR
jgi:succinate dehydrogenase / fumarate reductase flavoprotein subunit